MGRFEQGLTVANDLLVKLLEMILEGQSLHAGKG